MRTWLPIVTRHDLDRPTAEQMVALQQLTLPSGGRVTFEPGGQVELSTAPALSMAEALNAADTDIDVLHTQLAGMGLATSSLAVDHRRIPKRVLQSARYRAMESFFAHKGSAGTWMMCNTASTQVNLSHDHRDSAQRWVTIHLIAPVLISAFANSPGLDASGRQWASLRQAIWWSIDPGRTRPVSLQDDPATAWRRYAMHADVMLIRGDDAGRRADYAVAPGLPFARWMSEGHPAGWPTVDDFRYHLSTLFPPVRPRGWLELRVLDALPDWIRDCGAVTVATACTQEASAVLAARLPDTQGLWLDTARNGLQHPVLGDAAVILFDGVWDHLGGVTRDTRLIDQLSMFIDRYIRLRRCPGDDLTGSGNTNRLNAQRTPMLTCG